MAKAQYIPIIVPVQQHKEGCFLEEAKAQALKVARILAREEKDAEYGYGFFAFAMVSYFFLYESDGSTGEFILILDYVVGNAGLPLVAGRGLARWLKTLSEMAELDEERKAKSRKKRA